MKLKDKQELVRLLCLHMNDLLEANNANIAEVKKHNNKWEGVYTNGVKAQYEHARVLATRLMNEVNKEIKSYWEL